MKTANTQAAKSFGAVAFAKGLICAPALDSDMRKLIAGREIGDKRTIQELKAWISGWTQANLAE